jgi:hypothetical protein
MSRSIIFSVLFLNACALQSAQDDVQNSLIAKSAYDIQTRNISDGNVVQLSYKVRLGFPTQAIDSDRATTLGKQGWTPCSAIPPWEGFVDDTMQPSRFVHQSQRTFVKGNQLLVAGMQYFSKPARQRPSPDNNEQYVVVMKYDLANQDVRQQMSAVFPGCIKSK